MPGQNTNSRSATSEPEWARALACSVVIPTHNRPAQLDRCLAAVARLDYPRYDVLVVDNAPADDAAHTIAARCGARYLVEPVLGVSRARNRGARASDAEIIAYLDDDAVPEPSWLSALAAEFSDPAVMAVTGRILLLRVETEAERLFGLRGGFGQEERRRILDRQTACWFELAHFGGFGSGANMAFRRAAFDQGLGFDERIGYGTILAGQADHNALCAIVARGFRLVYTPHAVVHHPAPQSLPELRQRHLNSYSSSAAYLTYLFFEYPGGRRLAVQTLAWLARGGARERLEQSGRNLPRVVPRWREALAFLSGPCYYVAAVAERKLSGRALETSGG